MTKRTIVIQLDNHETATSSFYLDVFGFVRDRETTVRVGVWGDVDARGNAMLLGGSV